MGTSFENLKDFENEFFLFNKILWLSLKDEIPGRNFF
jgi:hypothetical protein